DPIASIGHLARLQLDLTLFGELAGIAQQVEQYLPQPHGVRGEDTQVLLGVDNETVLVLLGKLSGGADDLVDHRCYLYGLWVELELSDLDLRQVEHLVDEAEEMSPSAVQRLQRSARLSRDEACGDSEHLFGQPDDGIERRAQLVAHAGDELRLVLACSFELPPLVLDFVEQPNGLDRDRRLVREGRGEIDLSVAESSYHSAHQHNHADRDSFAQQGNAEHGTGAHLSCGSAQRVFRVILNVSYMDDVAFKRSSPSDRAPTRFELDLCHIVTDGGREPMACGKFVN